MPLKILIGPSSFAETDRAPLERLLAEGFAVIDNPYKRKITKDELFVLLEEDVIGILSGLEPLDRDVLSRSSLKCISRVGAGMSNIDLDAAKELNVAVCNTPDGPTGAVAELTVGALLGLLRWIPQSDRAMHEGKWARKMGRQVEGKTIAIVGFGRIGRRVADLLSPFRAKIIAVDPFLSGSETLPYPLLPLAEALPLTDIVLIHTSGDECLFDSRMFAQMKRGALILNVSRGSVVSEQALIEALDSGAVGGAWIDTFEKEPYDGPLCARENVILTPHIGSFTAECRQKMENEAVGNLLDVLKR